VLFFAALKGRDLGPVYWQLYLYLIYLYLPYLYFYLYVKIQCFPCARWVVCHVSGCTSNYHVSFIHSYILQANEQTLKES